MDPTNEVILSTLYTLNQPTSVGFLWRRVSLTRLVRYNTFQSRISDLCDQGYLRLDTAGRNVMLVSLTQAGQEYLSLARAAEQVKAGPRAQVTGQAVETAGMDPKWAALLVVLGGTLLMVLLCSALLLGRWQRSISTAQRKMTPLPDTALSTPALALAATLPPDQAAGVPSLTPPPTLTPSAGEKKLAQSNAADQLSELNIRVQIRVPEIMPAPSAADGLFNQLVLDTVNADQFQLREELQQALPDPGGMYEIDFSAVSAARWTPGERFPFITDSDSTTRLQESTLSGGHEVLSILFSTMSYLGGAHPSTIYTTLNYDLTAGRRLGLADLFLPGTPYLETIANYCLDELPRRYGNQLFDDFRKGAEALPENYRVWGLTRSGLLVVFGEYQLAPYASGPQYILVPYQKLSRMIDPAGPIGQYAQ